MKAKTVIDAVISQKGNSMTTQVDAIHFNGGFFFGANNPIAYDFVCSREQFNALVDVMTTNYGRSSFKHLAIWKNEVAYTKEESIPVFSQAMCDAGEALIVGMRVIHLAVEKIVCLPADANSKYVLKSVNDMYSLALFHDIKGIDTRTDEEKAESDINNIVDSFMLSEDVLTAIKAGKIHGVKWSIK